MSDRHYAWRFWLWILLIYTTLTIVLVAAVKIVFYDVTPAWGHTQIVDFCEDCSPVRYYGHDHRDWVDAASGRDLLRGKAGQDRLYGKGGDDDIYGDRGRDKLYGGELDDFLLGGPGDDLLNGGLGYDVCFGGKGADTFVGCEYLPDWEGARR